MAIAVREMRLQEQTMPARRRSAFIITVLGLLFFLYSAYTLLRQGDRALAFMLCGLSVIFVFAGLSIIPTGRRQTLTFSETLLDYLKEHDGYCPLGDKSDAEDIKEMFQVSKKTFKRATSHLYAQRLITINDTSMRLVDNE